MAEGVTKPIQDVRSKNKGRKGQNVPISKEEVVDMPEGNEGVCVWVYYVPHALGKQVDACCAYIINSYNMGMNNYSLIQMPTDPNFWGLVANVLFTI